jgi:hypothetical protein
MKDKKKKLIFKVPGNMTKEEDLQFAEMVYQKIMELVREAEGEEMLDKEGKRDG